MRATFHPNVPDWWLGAEVVANLDLTNVQRVVVIGASIMNMLAGNNLTTRHWESTNALNMPGIDVFGGSTSGEAMAAAIDNVAAALAAFPAVGGLIPGRSYEFRFVGSRAGSAGRISRFAEPGGTYVEVDPSLQPSTSNAPSAPLTATANAGGFVLITQSASAGTFSYLGGFSVQQA